MAIDKQSQQIRLSPVNAIRTQHVDWTIFSFHTKRSFPSQTIEKNNGNPLA